LKNRIHVSSASAGSARHVVDARQRADLGRAVDVGQQEVRLVERRRVRRLVDEILEAAVRRLHAGQHALVRADAPGERRIAESGRAFERHFRIVDAKRRCAQRQPVLLKECIRERVVLGVQHDRRRAVLEQRDVLRAVAAREAEPHPAEPVADGRGRLRVDREFDELEADVRGRRRRREQRLAGGRRVPFLREPRARQVFQIEQRTVAVGGRDRGRRGAKAVVEDFERQRARIAGLDHARGEAGEVEVALAGERPVVAAPFEHVHRELRRIGDLHEGDPLAGDGGDRVRTIVERQRVEAVEREAEVRAVHRVHELPRVAVAFHDAAPRERLVRGDHAGRARGLGERAELVDQQRVVRDRVGRHVAAYQDAVGAERVHHVELAADAVEVARELRRAHALEVAKGLEQHDVEPEIGGHAPHVGGRSIEVDEVVLEDLDTVEACGLDGGELLGKRAGQ
jgi:hypothetical protein